MDNYAGYRKLISKVLQVPENDVLPLKDSDIEITCRPLTERYYESAEILQLRFGLADGKRQILRVTIKDVLISQRDVIDFKLSARTTNCLKRYAKYHGGNNITIGGLAQTTEAEAFKIFNFDRKILSEIKGLLNSLKVCFAQP